MSKKGVAVRTIIVMRISHVKGTTQRTDSKGHVSVLNAH